MNLSQRTLFFVIVPIVVFAVVMIVVNYSILSESLTEHEIHAVTSIIQVSAYEMINPMNNLDIDRLNEIIDGIESQKNILQVLVLHPDGRVLTDGSDDDYSFGNVLHDDFLNSPNAINEKQIMSTEDMIRVSIPITLNEPIGILAIDYSLEEINNNITQLYHTIILVTVALLSGVIIASVIFSRSITEPIIKIQKSVDKMSKGEYIPHPKKIGIPEIRKLNNRIDEMYEKLIFFQKELSKNERLATIGEISARIAHDLRNPLTTIQNTVELLKMKNPDLIKENAEYFDNVDLAIKKINLEINGVLNHAKVRPLEKSNTQLSDIIEHSLSSLEIPKDIKITTPKNNTEIFCDGKQLENVFSNLIGNAIDAIGKNPGNITISLEEDTEFYKISVSDDGSGIPDDIIEVIFEPLFTTKQYGTGLGLVNCKNIVQAHNGTITVKNNPTTFTVKLPKKSNNLS